MNRYLAKIVFFVAFFTLGSGSAYSQIKLEGPETVRPGKTATVKVRIDKGADLKLVVLKDGKPTTQNYLGFKDLSDDSPVILFVDTETGIYTLIAVVNDTGKTYTATYVLIVGTPVPAPDVSPDPKPAPAPDPKPGFPKELSDLYKATPDAVTLDLISATFTDVKAFLPNIKSYGDFETTIAATAAKRIGDASKLRKVRDRIGDYLIQRTGTDPRAWDATKASLVCDEVLAAIKGCK